MKKTVAVAVFFFVVVLSGVFGQTTADDWFKKGNEYRGKKDYTNAIVAYSEAIKRDNSIPNIYGLRGIAYYEIKNYYEAIADFNTNIEKNPSVVTTYRLRGNSFYQIKNYDAAITDYNTYIEMGYDFPTSFIARGDSYGAKGIYYKAVTDYKTAIKKGFDPNEYDVGKHKNSVMSFCMAMYMEIIVNRFLGKSDVVTKYENWLKTVCDKNKVTRAEIEAFYRDNIRGLIAAMVDEEFKGKTTPASTVTYIKNSIILFFVKPDQFSYEHLLAVFALINLNQFMTISIDDSKIGNFDNYGRQIVTVDQYIRNLDDAGKQLNAPNNVGINWNELQTVFKSIIESLNSNLLEKFYNDSQEINRKLQKNR